MHFRWAVLTYCHQYSSTGEAEAEEQREVILTDFFFFPLAHSNNIYWNFEQKIFSVFTLLFQFYVPCSEDILSIYIFSNNYLIDPIFFYFLLSNLVNLGLYLFLVLFNTQSSIFFCLGLIDSGIFWLRATESNHRLRHCTDCTSLEPASRLFLAKYYQV